MCIHSDGSRLFGNDLVVSALRQHHGRNLQHDPLAAASNDVLASIHGGIPTMKKAYHHGLRPWFRWLFEDTQMGSEKSKDRRVAQVLPVNQSGRLTQLLSTRGLVARRLAAAPPTPLDRREEEVTGWTKRSVLFGGHT